MVRQVSQSEWEMRPVVFGYNGLGQYAVVLGGTGGIPVVQSSYTYDDAGRLTFLAQTYDGDTSNSEYDPAGPAGYEYQYDAASRITYMEFLGRENESIEYTYDATNQVKVADVGGSDGTNDETFDFDDNGNRKESTLDTASTTYGTPKPHNRMSSDGTYTYEYDAEGNLTVKQKITTGEREEFGWDHRNRLVSVTFKNGSGVVTQKIAYQYDVNNLRIVKSVDADGAGSGGAVATRYVLDGENVVLAMVDGALTNRYLQSPEMDRALVDEQVGGASYFLLTDHLGTVRDLVRGDGIYAGHVKYHVFGGQYDNTLAVQTVFAFTGAMFEAETGLQYQRARWYDPVGGRWISEDPLGFVAGDVNLGRYVNNAVVTCVDPNGLWRKNPATMRGSFSPGWYSDFRSKPLPLSLLAGGEIGFSYDATVIAECGDSVEDLALLFPGTRISVSPEGHRFEKDTIVDVSQYLEAMEVKLRHNIIDSISALRSQWGARGETLPVNALVGSSQIEANFAPDFDSVNASLVECEVAVKLIYAHALIQMVGKRHFDEYYTLATIPLVRYTDNASAPRRPSLLGDWGYLKNDERYGRRHREGSFQGQNVIYVGKELDGIGRPFDLYCGQLGNIKATYSERQWLQILSEEYDRSPAPMDLTPQTPGPGANVIGWLVKEHKFLDVAVIASLEFDSRARELKK